ncbi:unnamed protein product [Microthlaspi erraticum]|uniref:Knottin scorpion toxin-like domain-containing protein n=1 Tax=Microthlaspi erraticum TaxID=1685480 RepID=A0A6D2IPI4_9BRAS|nr:unnamed protein product [Microthlaspi erraticum]
MEGLRLSTVVVAVVFICVSVLLLSPIEVEGKCDFPYGFCPLWESTSVCEEKCLKFKTRSGETFYGGECRPSGKIITLMMNCYCCYYDDAVTGAENENM